MSYEVKPHDANMGWRASRRFLLLIQTTGLAFLLVYLAIDRDFEFSLLWTLGFPLIAVSVAVIAAIINLEKRYPKLNRHIFARKWTSAEEAFTQEERAKIYEAEMLRYQQAALRFQYILLTPGEDGLICIPVILIGVTPPVAVLGGLVFGALHAVARTPLDCLLKAVIYSLVCWFVLPHGVLTVVAGHFVNNIAALALGKSLNRATA